MLRVTVGSTVGPQAWMSLSAARIDPLAALIGTALLTCGVGLSIGFCSRLFAAAIGLVHAAALLGLPECALLVRVDPTAALVSLAAALAIALLGPGAFSVDARRFGRRAIFVAGRSGRR